MTPKDIEENISSENSDQSNLHKVPVLDDFVKTLLVSQMAISTDRQMEKFQERFYELWVRYHDPGEEWKMF